MLNTWHQVCYVKGCSNPVSGQCRGSNCGRFFCREHGDRFCADCAREQARTAGWTSAIGFAVIWIIASNVIWLVGCLIVLSICPECAGKHWGLDYYLLLPLLTPLYVCARLLWGPSFNWNDAYTLWMFASFAFGYLPIVTVFWYRREKAGSI